MILTNNRLKYFRIIFEEIERQCSEYLNYIGSLDPSIKHHFQYIESIDSFNCVRFVGGYIDGCRGRYEEIADYFSMPLSFMTNREQWKVEYEKSLKEKKDIEEKKLLEKERKMEEDKKNKDLQTYLQLKEKYSW